MDLIVRTAHGTADVAVDVHDPATTLRELLALITGQAAPHAALVDGRPVDTDRPIRACGVVAGSVVDTDLSRQPPAGPPDAALLQLTGPGAGTVRPLGTGRYRVGPGRRVAADELVAGHVDDPAFELAIQGSTATLIATRSGSSARVAHDGAPVIEDEPWESGFVTFAGRTFAFEPAADHTTGATELAAVHAGRATDEHGRFLYNRPPGVSEQRRLGLIDAVRDAVQLTPDLWRQRLEPGAACWVDLGLAADTTRPVRLDIATELVVAITGDHDLATAHARALVTDAVTRYGPADLDVAIAADREHLADWEWAKWLPHTRLDGAPLLLTHDIDLGVFAARRIGGGPRRTLLVVTSDRFWSSPTAPLRHLVLGGPPELSVIVLTDRAGSAPASCDAVVEHRDRGTPGVAELIRPSGASERLGLLAPLPAAATAREAARHLAPLVDPDAVAAADPHADPDTDGPSLADFVGFGPPSDPGSARWKVGVGATSPAIMPVGTFADTTIGVDLGPGRGVVVSGATLDDARDVMRTLVASIASAWSPGELSIVAVDHRIARAADPLAGLPHHAGVFGDRGPRSARRFIDRLNDERAADPSRRLVVVVDGLAATELATPGLVAELARRAAASPGLHLLVATDEPIDRLDDAIAATCSIEITAERPGGRRHATLLDRTSGLRTPFRPFEPPVTSAHPTKVVPFVFGRSLTPLERRIERSGPIGDGGEATDREYERLVDALRAQAAANGLAEPPSLVPQQLPDAVSAEQLLTGIADGAIALGVAEAVGRSEPVPYRWWPDGEASLLVLGSARSGMRTALDVLLFGMARRAPAGALRVDVVEHHEGRRAAIGQLDVVERTATPNHADEVDALFEALLDGLRSRADGEPASPHVSLVLVVRDVERLTTSAREQLGALIAAEPPGLAVVASASRLDAVADLVDGFDQVLVGELSDPSDYEALGLTEQAEVEQRPGRCLLVGDQRLVQLATLAEPLDAALGTAPPPTLPAIPSPVPPGTADDPNRAPC